MANDESIDNPNYEQKTLASIISGHRTKRKKVGHESIQERFLMQIEPTATTSGSGTQSSFSHELLQMADYLTETTKAPTEKEKSEVTGALDNVSETKTTRARSKVTKAITSTIEPATAVKATGKRKRSDDENLKIADGNSEQKNNMSATTSARPAKRQRSDESNLDTIHLDHIHQNSIHKDTVHRHSIHKATVHQDAIPEEINSSTTISDSDLKSSSQIQPNLHDIDQDNLDDISEKKKATNTSTTTKKAPRTKTAPKKVPTRSSSKAKPVTLTTDINSS